jgi:hypothetical protein
MHMTVSTRPLATFVPVCLATALTCCSSPEENKKTQSDTLTPSPQPTVVTPPVTETTSARVASRQVVEYAEGEPLPEADTLLSTPPPWKAVIIAGELWIQDTVAGTSRQLTHINNQIDEARLSPNGKYAACMLVMGQVESAGEYSEGEKAPMENLYDILVVNAQTGELVRQIPPPEDIFVWADRWLSNSRLVLSCSSHFSVNAFYVYDAFRDSLQKVRWDFDDEGRSR